MKLTITILGFGYVGKQICSLLLHFKNHEFTINIIEISENEKGAFLDFQHAVQHHPNHELSWNSHENFNQSDFLFHCAGSTVQAGESRLSVCEHSTKITEKIFKDFNPTKEPKIICISNPVEIIAFVTQKITGLPATNVIGTGTLLDSVRMDHYVEEDYPAYRNVKTVLLGEHGQSVFMSKQLSNIDGNGIDQYLNEEQENYYIHKVKNAAQEIKKTQEATVYGVSTCAIRLFEYFLDDQKQQAPVSIQMPKWLSYKLNSPQIYLSLYADINKTGAFINENYQPNEWELSKLKESADVLVACFDDRYLN